MALAEDAEGQVRVLMDKKDKTTLGIQIVGDCAPETDIICVTCGEKQNDTGGMGAYDRRSSIPV